MPASMSENSTGPDTSGAGLDRPGTVHPGQHAGLHDLRVIEYPALLPVVVVLAFGGTEMVDEQGRAAGRTCECREHAFATQRERRCTCAEADFLRAGRLAARPVAGHYQRGAAGVAEGRHQRRGPGALRLADVGRLDGVAQAQSAGNDGRILQVAERHGGRGERQPVNRRDPACAQRVPRGFHRHVTLSSSQPQNARRPLPRERSDGAIHLCVAAVATRSMRNRGT